MRIEPRYQRIPSRHLGRRVHLWKYGWWGQPVLVFPTASGMAHEWQAAGAIDALGPLIDAGRLKLYCVESNVAHTFTAGDVAPWERMARHEAYERFVTDELVPWIHADCHSELPLVTIGASVGSLYAATMALKHPEIFRWALCLSGRYDVEPWLDGWFDDSLYYNAPLAFVPNLDGHELARVQQNTKLTLVVGLGPFENSCIPETLRMAAALSERGIPVERDVWGHDSAHHWDWWKRQLQVHLSRL